MALDYSRPKEGFRFDWGGLKLNSQPDSMPPAKYPSAVNVRATSNRSLRCRPGYTQNFSCDPAAAVTDIKAYATLETDDKPRFLARDSANGIWLDNSVRQTVLAGTPGAGVSMIAFRPGASSQSWMYIASQAQYVKMSAPDASGLTVVQKAGIAEPQKQLEAATNAATISQFTGTHTDWTASGTAGSLADSNVFTDTVGAAVLADPVVATRISVQVSIPYYAPGMLLTFRATDHYPVEELWPACATTTIAAIRYDAGSTGLCSIVPTVNLGDTIGHGSIIKLGGSENALVLSVTTGTNSSCVLRCSTTGTFAAGDAILGVLAVVVHGTATTGDAITVPSITSTLTTGEARIDRALTAGLFSPYSQDDYIHVLMLLQDIANVTSVSFIFNVSGASPDYSKSILTYMIQGAALEPFILAGELVEIVFPISALSTKPGALNPCNGIRIDIVTAAGQAIAFSGFWVGGGSLPDVGDAGAPYMFRAVPRSSLTGAQGNSTPPMRYGVTPRRQSVTVTVPDASYDTQIDIWDYYAKGGTVTDYGYVGSVSVGSSSFTFNSFDDAIIAAIAAGRTLPVQNYEPWPSIDVSFAIATGTGITITAFGDEIEVTSNPNWPATTPRWLPGTLLTVDGFASYTLRARPIPINSTSYLFQIEECIGDLSILGLSVAEPIVANQILPYMWGPDAYGTVFGCGDPLRPGTQYWAKPYAPDEAPQTNTNEVTSPDKPLLGGVVLGGLSISASTLKWWAWYPNLAGSGYNPVEWPVGATPVSPYAIVTDGSWVYFWTREGIARTQGGGFESLTDDDLYNLFPHEGVAGRDVVRVNFTYRAPDYSRAAAFRLCCFNNFLYAIYQDASGTYRMLTCDLRTKSWCADQYDKSISAMYGIEQQASSLTTAPALYSTLQMGTTDGTVQTQLDFHNDGPTPITVRLQTFEFDGGDVRAFEQWGDLYLDSNPISTITATPVSGGTPVFSTTVIPAAPSRSFTPISLGGKLVLNYIGLALTWTDNFALDPAATNIQAWQPQFEPWPVISQANSPWMNIQPGGAAAYLQGFLLPCESGGQPVLLSVLTDLSQTPIPVTAVRVPLLDTKTPMPFTLDTPVICHQAQIVRRSLCRLWLDEIQWVSEATPEVATTWKTQRTSHGMPGYHSILRLEVAYSSTADIALAITTFDGTAPAGIVLPATGGAKQRLLVTPTFNKGTLYDYAATSPAPAQLFNELIVYVGAWGRSKSARAYNLLGGAFDDKAIL